MSSISRNPVSLSAVYCAIDPILASSHYQLARVLQNQAEYAKALSEADAALKLQPNNASVHYLRGQILQHLGRTEEAKGEMQKAAGISNQARAQREKELENPDPDLRPSLFCYT